MQMASVEESALPGENLACSHLRTVFIPFSVVDPGHFNSCSEDL